MLTFSSALYLLVFNFLAPAVDSSDSCKNVQTVDAGLYKAYCDGPFFQSLLPDTEENRLLDNVCFTFFPAPDDPNTYFGYEARVYCDGSYSVMSFVGLQASTGIQIVATPFVTATDHTIGYPGCDIYLIYRCSNFGASFDPFVYAASFTCNPVGLSCLRKVEELIRDRGLPEQDFYVLPMKLPNRCVTQQLCIQPPNPFYNHLPGVSLI
ncbi:uncharacterized protein LOC124368535 isoform X2 [Homalodisca vitripennis]|nr:uncharacterized protein LOC124368535 isoform X2 [Homalodisca vitripennis]KAG8322134.1 hypothetical protein J6590_029832 [Homalodisca vitripennis]